MVLGSVLVAVVAMEGKTGSFAFFLEVGFAAGVT
jgi:hypothetical protein